MHSSAYLNLNSAVGTDAGAGAQDIEMPRIEGGEGLIGPDDKAKTPECLDAQEITGYYRSVQPVVVVVRYPRQIRLRN
jgi:hypothetical protein